MIKPTIPVNEKDRLKDLYSYSLPDLIQQSEFDNLVKLAATICQTPIALITLVDTDKQWFKAKLGIEGNCTDRDVSFCGHAINTPGDNLIIEDATKDERFMNNPLVTGDPYIVFYAGVPLVTNEGHALGTICVIDRKPRTLSTEQYQSLETLSQQVIRLFELRKTVKLLEEKEDTLERVKRSIDDFSTQVCHDVKMAFKNIEISTELISNLDQQQSKEADAHLKIIKEESVKMIQHLNGLTPFSEAIDGSLVQK